MTSTATLDKGDITAPKSSIVRVVCEGYEVMPDTLFDGGAVKIEGKGLAGATECIISYQDMAGAKHNTTYASGNPTSP